MDNKEQIKQKQLEVERLQKEIEQLQSGLTDEDRRQIDKMLEDI